MSFKNASWILSWAKGVFSLFWNQSELFQSMSFWVMVCSPFMNQWALWILLGLYLDLHPLAIGLAQVTEKVLELKWARWAIIKPGQTFWVHHSSNSEGSEERYRPLFLSECGRPECCQPTCPFSVSDGVWCILTIRLRQWPGCVWWWNAQCWTVADKMSDNGLEEKDGQVAVWAFLATIFAS